MKKLHKVLYPNPVHNKETPIQPSSPNPLDPPIKMQIEEQKKDINVDEILEESSFTKDKKVINLDDDKNKKKKKEYDIDDTIIRDITLSGDIHVRLISNANGYFVDLRKYFNGYPTRKGIRILATKFNIAAGYLRKDLETLIGKPIFGEENK